VKKKKKKILVRRITGVIEPLSRFSDLPLLPVGVSGVLGMGVEIADADDDRP